MSTLTESDLADFAARYAGVEWAVYAQGLDRVLTHEIPDVPPNSPGNRPLDHDGALALAEQLVEDVASLNALHGVQAFEITPIVLHRGAVWTGR